MPRLDRTEDDEFAAKRFEANQLFTPSAPVNVVNLFAGRHREISRIVDVVGERGRHVVLYGERGVGKSSVAQIIPYFIPTGIYEVRHIRVQVFPHDRYTSIAKKIFHEIMFEADYGEGERLYSASEFYDGEVTPDDFVREMRRFKETEIPIIIIDEFNEVEDVRTSTLIAHSIKALSDTGSNATIIIVGVADNVNELIEGHESIERCVEEVQMPRMTADERRQIIDQRLAQLGMTIAGDAKWKIVNLSRGLPAYVHALGKFSVFKALGEHRLHVVPIDVDAAINSILQGSQQSIKDAYEKAIRSNQPANLLRHVLTACALAKGDESGYFTPTAVRDPLSEILVRSVEIANFQEHLKAFVELSRGKILERIGQPRSYRFRFENPAMQPYVIMRGIRDGLIDEKAKHALSSPDQTDLFASD